MIFDRYIYDELANLPLNHPVTRAFVWVVLKLVPKPDVTYVIDADPLRALARKPEYPVGTATPILCWPSWRKMSP